MNSAGKELVEATATEVRPGGWKRPVPFNVAAYLDEIISDLYRELSVASQRSVGAESRGERRIGRRVAWSLAKALMDLNEEKAVVMAAMDLDPVPSGMEWDTERLRYMIARRRAEVALGTEHWGTYRRGLLAIRALTRLGQRLTLLEIIAPIARVRASATDAPPTDAPDGRREDVERGIGLRQREDEGEDETRNESRPRGSAVRPSRTRPSRTRGAWEVPDGWDGDDV